VREPPSNGSHRLWLVRHGESSWNAQHLVQGHADWPTLTSRGLRQAHCLGRQLSSCGISALYSSDLRRATQTAAIVADRVGVEVRTDPRLRERGYGVLEGCPAAALTTAVTGLSGDRIADVDVRPVGGESLRDLFARACSFLDWLSDEHASTGRRATHLVIVAHGGMVRALRSCVLGVPIAGTTWDPVPNGSILQLCLPARPSQGALQAMVGGEGK
jgi:probable phosphoglycerate mutase